MCVTSSCARGFAAVSFQLVAAHLCPCSSALCASSLASVPVTYTARGLWCFLILCRGKRPRLPPVPMNIVHQSFHRRHHQQRAGVQLCLPSPIIPSPCSHSHFLCVLCKTAATDVNVHVLGVCVHLKDLEIAYAIAMFTASWYFAIFISRLSNV